ncbi:probable E3 ubiquitin-protein ligase HIP1 [Solanum stenotomum]|uniref:probable E3 ubiquitin-protein ligase HIP1 n=1 Tax=Solanum stenotomum TaxID=172797 RepID=UPI0020D1C782|nr:probable E3 ubiquitin-protein ligase HIP1 [Solanum stenotomum]
MDFVENSTHPTFFEQYTNYHGGSSSASTHQSNAFTLPSGDPVRYLREHGLWDIGRDVYFLRNNIDSQSLSHGGIIMEPGHRDDPIVIEDDEEDEHGDAQHDDIFYDGEMSYEALLELQEHIGGVEIGLKKSDISKLLKQSKYQSAKMKNYSESCCICLDTYDDGAELGIINCGHEFHYQCIRRWLKRNNSCPVCRRIALTP